MLFYPAMSCTVTYFFKRRGLALGFVASGSSLGGKLISSSVQLLTTHILTINQASSSQ